MDKQLLKALDNLSVGLEQLVEALNKKGESKTDTGSALQSGDFGKSLEQISVDIQSIKTDTQEILKNQQTIIGLFKQKKDEKKTDEMEGAGDPKKESQIKKGLATILLIAVAVLAIGMAFKLVGKVNILSVLALGIGIMLVAFAFERVSKIKGPTGGAMTIKEAVIISAIMVIASLAITVSSWIFLPLFNLLIFCSSAVTIFLVSSNCFFLVSNNAISSFNSSFFLARLAL
jgi:cation transport ATPase